MCCVCCMVILHLIAVGSWELFRSYCYVGMRWTRSLRVWCGRHHEVYRFAWVTERTLMNLVGNGFPWKRLEYSPRQSVVSLHDLCRMIRSGKCRILSNENCFVVRTMPSLLSTKHFYHIRLNKQIHWPLCVLKVDIGAECCLTCVDCTILHLNSLHKMIFWEFCLLGWTWFDPTWNPAKARDFLGTDSTTVLIKPPLLLVQTPIALFAYLKPSMWNSNEIFPMNLNQYSGWHKNSYFNRNSLVAAH